MSEINTRFIDAARNVLTPQPAEAPRGNYIPTLVVGIGGTGIRTLRFLKKQLQASPEHQIQILGIDCDAAEQDKYPDLPLLDIGTELVYLDAKIAHATIIQAERSKDPYLLGYLPDTHGARTNIHTEVQSSMSRQRGAGQRRRVGRVITEANADGGAGLINIIRAKHDALRGLTARIEFEGKGYNFLPHAQVYVVSSLAGGTGAGSLLSMLALLRTIFNGPHDRLTVVGVLPGLKLDDMLTNRHQEAPSTRANAVALLRELQAARISKFPEYEFQFGPLNRLPTSTADLVSAVYLLDHELHDGTPLPNYQDICRSAAMFLFAFVGTGVGAADASGDVNQTAVEESQDDGIPRCFDALGLSVLAYPIDDLLAYCSYDAFCRWSRKWLDGSGDPALAEQCAHNLTLACGLANEGTFISRFLGAINLNTPGFLTEETERSEVVRNTSDGEFKQKATTGLTELEESLRSTESRLKASVDQTKTALLATLHAAVLSFLDHPAQQAKKNLDALCASAINCQSLLAASLQNNETEIQDLEEKVIPSKEWWLILPGDLLGNRTKYIEAINSLMDHKLSQAVGPSLLRVLGEIVAELEALKDRLGLTISEIKAMDLSCQKFMEKMDQDQTASEGLTVFAMRRAEFKAFCAEVPDPGVTGLGLDKMTAEAIAAAVITRSIPIFEPSLRTLNLPENLEAAKASGKADHPLLRAVKAADAAAQPRLRLRDDLPHIHQLAPRKYVVGQNIQPAVAALFPPRSVSQNMPVAQFTDPYRIIVVETFHHFGAAHWMGFDTSLVHYKADPWWRHVLPDEQITQLPDFSA